ncbi:MAG TPA: aconitase/3-isopropylmalate dehydratase large subunit family protein [Phycisphaerae bacterium]|nr:aconitase/3-isopropylmalate dehydratase large subunit family protein [Phycisphaerae bacterium]HRY70275.1 aconitase/3-isopropylmalate dehydratase large subunit family protein [Phycisphaerae bacterium]HSA27554.1 aconitase/3-isopropylmalate dehydratase large subunit family protein [Phycisphaerae bacterium]
MGQTLTEKILAKHAGKPSVRAGDNIWVSVDILMTHDVCGPGTIGVFKENFGPAARVWDPERVIIIPDHYIFTADKMAHRNIDILRAFVREQGIKYYYDPDFIQGEGMPSPYKDPTQTSYKGVCHKTLPEEGHVRPGEILLGTDSHTCTAGAFGQFATGIGNTDAGFVLGTGKLWLKVPPTMKFVFHGQIPPYLTAKDLILAVIGRISVSGATYKAMHFTGEGIASLTLEDRMTLTNMAIEAGGKNGVCDVDEKTLRYVKARSNRARWEVFTDDADAKFDAVHAWDLAHLEPLVAKPHSPDNIETARNCQGTRIDRAYLGSCTGGKITDMIFAAAVLNGRQVSVPTFVVPGSTEVHADMLRLNIRGETRANGEKSVMDVLKDAGCTIGPSGCAACLGGPADTFGRLNQPMACISTTNRNFPGRMGHRDAGVYLASPLTVAASAVTGRVTDPRDYISAPIPTGTAGVV